MNRLLTAILSGAFLLIVGYSATHAAEPDAQPAAVAGKGYKLVWNDEFENLNSIDVNDTGKAGYKWYVNTGTFSAKVASCVTSPEASVVRIDNGGFPNWQLSSSYSPNVGLNLAGADGFYVEGRIRFSAHRDDQKTGWPAFWMNPTENTYGVAQWPGQVAGYINRVECDIMEYGLGDLNSYYATVHQWVGVSRWGVEPYVFNGEHFIVPYHNAEVPNNKWHTYGCLMVPSTKAPNGHGYIQFFLDNVATSVRVEWTGSDIGTPPPVAPHLYANFEHQHHVILLGTGKNWPMDVDWVRVWQVTSAAQATGSK